MQVDVDAVDFGLVAFGFRYAKEFTLHNTCAIPMQYAWRVPKDSLDPAHKEFTVSSICSTMQLHIVVEDSHHNTSKSALVFRRPEI